MVEKNWAMNVSSALGYLQVSNMVVVTVAIAPTFSWAALETATQCLIPTGHIPLDPPQSAEDLEIPILSVDLDDC